MWPTRHIGMMTTRGESSRLRLQHNTLTLHCQSIKSFKDTLYSQVSSAKPFLLPYLLCLPHST